MHMITNSQYHIIAIKSCSEHNRRIPRPSVQRDCVGKWRGDYNRLPIEDRLWSGLLAWNRVRLNSLTREANPGCAACVPSSWDLALALYCLASTLHGLSISWCTFLSCNSDFGVFIFKGVAWFHWYWNGESEWIIGSREHRCSLGLLTSNVSVRAPPAVSTSSPALIIKFSHHWLACWPISH